MDNYAFQFQNFINRLQFNSSPYYYFNDVFDNNLDAREKTRLNNVSLTCAVIAWALLYSVFKKYLNVSNLLVICQLFTVELIEYIIIVYLFLEISQATKIWFNSEK